jgi:23S rRNA (pseudouridine1915-N3)-methyltransferase
MQPLRVIWVGKTEKGFVQDAVDFYASRIRALQPLELIDVRLASHSGRQPQVALAEESESILRRVGAGSAYTLLDEAGREMTSREFASWLSESQPATFVVGGPYGVAPTIRDRARECLSLSRLTFPHQLARVVLLEQIYRALTLQRGHAYHHA